MFSRNFGSCPGCRFSPPLNQKRVVDAESHRSHVVFLPMMVSRLMFSLRKTAAEQVGSSSATGNSGIGRLPEGESVRFAQQWFDVSHEISTVLVPSSGEIIELNSQSSRDRGSQKSC